MMRSIVGSLAFVAMFLNVAMATKYIVGSPSGSWDATTNLQAWAKPKVFSVGDSLTFQYATFHDVVEVSKKEFDACSSSNAIKTDKSGTTVVPLTKAGTRYFICGTPGHCAAGMKLAVNVLPASSAVAVSPSAAPLSSSPVGAPSVLPDADGPTTGFGLPPLPGSPLSQSPSSPSSATRGTTGASYLVAFVVGAFVVHAFSA